MGAKVSWYSIEIGEQYNTLVVREDPSIEDLNIVVSIIEKWIGGLRIEIKLSQKTKVTEEFLQTLVKLDDTAKEKFYPVTLHICRCCIKELKAIHYIRRWRSRWEIY